MAEPDGQRVQLMTVHAAKGLEWDAVFVAGLTQDVFPVGRPAGRRLEQAARDPAVPAARRPRRAARAGLAWAAPTRTTPRRGSSRSAQACRDRGALEERRLAYVAVTRARSLLACSGYWWDTTARSPAARPGCSTRSRRCARRAAGTVDTWAAGPGGGRPEPDGRRAGRRATGPTTRSARGGRRAVPRPPVRLPRPAGRREAAHRSPQPTAGAAVRRGRRATGSPSLGPRARAAAGRARPHPSRRRRAGGRAARRLSVSQLVELRRDPVRLARSLRRPLPRQPAPQARRGTRFHLWLEQLWGQQRLLDVDELPGSADESAAPDDDLVALQDVLPAQRLGGAGARRGGVPLRRGRRRADLLRGRCDAVFTDAPDGDGRRRRRLEDRRAAHRRRGDGSGRAARGLPAGLAPRHRHPAGAIRAAFHYVAAKQTVRPADLLDHDGLVALLAHRPGGGARDGAQAGGAFAAAFFCALNSRTFCSDSASTTSATER